VANSVSKINVLVGANTSQLTAGMQQASSAVRGFSASAGNMQMAMQQAVFAVDDAASSFGTGGIAGSIRGAANNISMLASSLFGVKGLMVAVGITAATQLAMSFMKTKDEAETAKKGIDELRNSLDALTRQRERRRGLDAAGSMPLDDVADEISQRRKRIDELSQALQVRREQLKKDVGDRDPFGNRHEFDQETLKPRDTGEFLFSEEIRANATEIRQLEKDLNSLAAEMMTLEDRRRRANNDARRAGAEALDQPFITGEMRSVMAGQMMDIDAEIAQLRESMMPSLSMGNVFGMLPNAQSMGSSGAISAINAAQIGPQNARDAGPALQRETNRILSRIEQLEKDKKNLVEVIGL
jgi:hypothetical protein